MSAPGRPHSTLGASSLETFVWSLETDSLCQHTLGGLTFQPHSSSAVLRAKAAALSFKCRGGLWLEHIPRQLPRDAGNPWGVPITLPGWVSEDGLSTWVPTTCWRPGWSFPFLAFSLAYAQLLFGELQGGYMSLLSSFQSLITHTSKNQNKMSRHRLETYCFPKLQVIHMKPLTVKPLNFHLRGSSSNLGGEGQERLWANKSRSNLIFISSYWIFPMYRCGKH